MAQTIYIRLPGNGSDYADSHDLQVEWCASDGIGRPAVQRESLHAVLELAAGKQLIVLVPSDEIVMTEVSLPIRQRAKLLQAIPFALEEQLAEDVEKLHFAVGEKQANGNTPVLVVAHKKITQWLELFKTSGIVPKALLPDVLCLPGPVGEQHWSLLTEGTQALVRTAPNMGFSCDVESLPDYLSLTDNSDNLRLKITSIGSENALSISALQVQSVDVDTSMRSGLEAMRLTDDSSKINLLQGAYASQQGYDHWWRPFRLTAALLLVSISLATTFHAIEYFSLKSEMTTLETANKEMIARLFPEIKTLVPGSERVQLERRLKELRGQGNTSGLFLPLSILAEGLQAVGNLTLQELQLREGVLFLNLTAKDIATLERLKAHFEKLPAWVLAVESANSGSDGVQIRASLKGAQE